MGHGLAVHRARFGAAMGALALAWSICAPFSALASAPGGVLTAHVTRARIRPGQAIRIYGVLRGPGGPLAGELLELQAVTRRSHGFINLAHTVTRRDGSYRFPAVRPGSDTRYRTIDVAAPSTRSVAVRVLVRVPIVVYPASGRVTSAAHYLAGRAGTNAFAVVDNTGKLAGTGLHVRFHSASVVKSMLLVAYLQTLAAEHRGLDSASSALLYPMIHSSDNGAADGVFAVVGNSGLARVARQAHMTDFLVSYVWWGFTEISAADMARFFLIQDSLIPRQFDGYARWLFSTIEPSESWGAPAVARPEFQVFFKGGWLPKSEGLVNQAARLEHGRDTFAMAVLTRGDPSMSYGEETIAGVTSRLLGRG